MPSKLIPAVMALSGFALALVAGMAARNTAITTLWRALLAMAVCYFVGLALAAVARYAIREHVELYKADHPIEPSDSTEDFGAQPSESAVEPGIATEPGSAEPMPGNETSATTGPAAGAAA